MAHETFISHSSEDKVIADAVTAALEQANIRCWIAPRDIRPGESWGGAIVEAIEASRVMVVIFSSNSNDSKQVMREVERAVKHDVIVVPFRIEDVQPTRDMEYFLSSTHWLDAMSPEMDAHLQELSKTVSNFLNKTSDDRTVAKASKKAAASISKVAKARAGSKFASVFTAVVAAAVVGIAAMFFFSGDDNPQNSAGTRSTASEAEPKQVGDISLEFASQVRAGANLDIRWTGPSAPKDYITIVPADAADNVKLGLKRIEDNESLTVPVPDAPGSYQVRYFDAASNTIIAQPELSVTLPEITLEAPASGMAGSEISVDWTGPNDRSDQLTIAATGSQGRQYLTYASIARGSPTEIRLPDEQGEFELRYVSGGDREIWKAQRIKVELPEVSIKAMPSQIAGAEVKIAWQGPANKSDYLAVAQQDAEAKDYISYAYVKTNRDAKLRMPAQAGEYEIRYVSGQSKNIWAVQPIIVEMPEVSIDVPNNVKVGDTVKVTWQGPANRGDYISIAEPDSAGSSYVAYQYVKEGQVAQVQMPQEPGDYQIRYISAADKTIWFSAPLTVLERNETIQAPEQVVVDNHFTVSWLSDGYAGQYIGVFPADAADDARYLTYVYTNKKTSGKLRAPKEPGNYELRYVSGNQDQVWARRPITVISP